VKGRTFIDEVVIRVKAGNGGDGAVSFRREKYVPKGGPDGGDGGRGGHIILRADRETDSLIALHYAPEQKAEHGGKGRGAQKHGADGSDLVLKVPCGTEVRDESTGEVTGEIVEEGAELMVARGGRGGRGNWHWRSPTNQVPMQHTDGIQGEEFQLRLSLKIVADVGLVGYPNAGKSSLLAAISDAHPKVAAYPFTTLNPVIGTVVFDDFTRVRVADIPGIVKGAHDGVGLGLRFLRHIERSRFLIYVLDAAGVDGRDPVADYESLRKEITFHEESLADRPFFVVANKMDLPDAAEGLKRLRDEAGLDPVPISAFTGDGAERVKTEIKRRISDMANEEAAGPGSDEAAD